MTVTTSLLDRYSLLGTFRQFQKSLQNIQLEEAEREFQAARHDPNLTREQLNVIGLAFWCRAYRDPVDGLKTARNWTARA